MTSCLYSENRFALLSEESLCDVPFNLGLDDAPVAPRHKRHCISAAGLPDNTKPNLPYEPRTSEPCSINQLLVKFLSPHPKLPTKGSKLAAGYDLYASESVSITSGNRKLIDTGIAIATRGTQLYARIAHRSGLSVKGLDIGAGDLDAEYRGSMKVLLINNSKDTPFQINPGDRMAELILERIENPECVRVDTLPVTTRGNQGFGSIGISGKTRISCKSVTINAADLVCGDPMVLPVAIWKNNFQESWLPASAMIDSGASTLFIDPDFANQLGLILDLKPIPNP